MANQELTMPRKGQKGAAGSRSPEATKQIAFRVPASLAVRLERTAARLGLDASNFMRMVLLEHMTEYERRADRIEGKGEGEA